MNRDAKVNYPGFLLGIYYVLGIGTSERPFVITLQAERREGEEYNL
jgi:hypothetical protein